MQWCQGWVAAAALEGNRIEGGQQHQGITELGGGVGTRSCGGHWLQERIAAAVEGNDIKAGVSTAAIESSSRGGQHQQKGSIIEGGHQGGTSKCSGQ